MTQQAGLPRVSNQMKRHSFPVALFPPPDDILKDFKTIRPRLGRDIVRCIVAF